MAATTVALHGSTDNITFVPLITWTNGLKGSGTWCHPGQPGYRYFDLVVAGHAGAGNVTAEIDTLLWRLSGFRAGRPGNVVTCAEGAPDVSGARPLRFSAAGYPSPRDQATVRMLLFAPMAAPRPEFSFHRPKPQVRDLSGVVGLIHLLAHQLQQLSLRRRHPGKVPVPTRPEARRPGR